MADIHIRLDFSLSKRARQAWLAALLLTVSAAELGSESVTLTTYYPAPSGVYTNMITTGNTWIARDGGVVGIGTKGNTPSAALEVDGDVVAVQSNGGCSEKTIDYTTCNGGTTASICPAGQYATLSSGVISKYSILGPPLPPAVIANYCGSGNGGYTVYYLCCPCANNTCPSL